jgi:hypothetical protein
MRLKALWVIGLLFAGYAQAQQMINVRAAVNCFEGTVYLDGAGLVSPVARPIGIGKGQILSTGSGRVEVQLGLSGSLWMGENGRLRILDPGLTNMALRIENGSVLVEIIEVDKKNRLSLHLGESVIEFQNIGLYGLDVQPARLRVYEGEAAVLRMGKRRTVKHGRMAILAESLKSSKFKRKQTDALHLWAAQRSRILYDRIKAERAMELARRQKENELAQRRMEEDARRRAMAEYYQQLAKEQAQRIEQEKQQELLKNPQQTPTQ